MQGGWTSQESASPTKRLPDAEAVWDARLYKLAENMGTSVGVTPSKELCKCVCVCVGDMLFMLVLKRLQRTHKLQQTCCKETCMKQHVKKHVRHEIKIMHVLKTS